MRRRLRSRVFDRDRGTCAACGLDVGALAVQLRRIGLRKPKLIAAMELLGFDLSRSLWEADHVVPLADGGRDVLVNMATMCQPCHFEKTKREQRARGGS